MPKEEMQIRKLKCRRFRIFTLLQIRFKLNARMWQINNMGSLCNRQYIQRSGWLQSAQYRQSESCKSAYIKKEGQSKAADININAQLESSRLAY